MRFEVGDKVVYPNHGVGVIEDIKRRAIADTDQNFYHLRILANDTIVMVPVGNSKAVGLRKIFRKAEVKKLYIHLRDPDFETHKNWKGRYKENAEKMRSGHLVEMGDVLKNLMHLSQRKALSYREKRMYEKAKTLTLSEVAIVEGDSENDVRKKIEEALADCMVAREARKSKAS